MWQCVKCREQLGDNFEVCWNCGTSSAGIEDPGFRKADDIPAEEIDESPSPSAVTTTEESTAIQVLSEADASNRKLNENRPLDCLRCGRALNFVGTKSFHEGFQWGVFGDLGELFVNQESFDVYVCPKCGRVEFFVTGLGEELRPRKASD
jgi:predicted RNA-binding Zn-ribbon protein involved in translation (DUF1610 family)